MIAEWRLRDIEQMAQQAKSRLYELDDIKSRLYSAEHKAGEIDARQDRLSGLLNDTIQLLAQAMQRIELLERKLGEES